MNSYYQSLIAQLVDLFARQEYETVAKIVDTELDMPYVDREAQEILEQYKADVQPCLAKVPMMDRNKLEAWIDGSAPQPQMAASALQAMNLRQFVPEVQSLLSSSVLEQEFKGELIEALMEQKIDEELTISKDGMEISFIPSVIVPAQEDPVLKKARECLDKWLSADNPSLLSFCQTLLEQEILEMRPFDFDGIDPAALAAGLVRLVFLSMQDPSGWEQFCTEHKLASSHVSPLLIEKRGE